MAEYDVVLLSDVGYNTLARPPVTFDDFERVPGRVQLTDDFAGAGGGLVMIGGSLSFQGFTRKARYEGTPFESALSVSLQSLDNRVERSVCVTADSVSMDHETPVESR
jgi:uncharacterized membrane protein